MKLLTKISIVVALFSPIDSNALPWDYKIVVAFDKKMKPRDVCGNLATARFYNIRNNSYSADNRDCAPTVGSAFALTQRSKTIAIIDNRPDLASYLGRVKRRGELDRDGDSGSVCGGGITSSIASGLVDLKPTFENVFTVEYSLKQVAKSSIVADIDQILSEYLISQPKRNSLTAEISTVLDLNKDKLVKFNATFQEYQLPDSTLTALEAAASPESPLKPCLDELRTGNWRMYRAITGIRLNRATATSSLRSVIGSDIALKIKAEAPQVDLVDIEARLESSIRTSIEKTESDRFTVIGVSFWRSARWPEIR